MIGFAEGRAQKLDPLEKKYNIGEVEVDILGSYYQQDGVHSAVEGGVGNQYLTDAIGTIVVKVPFDSINIIGISLSADAYTSASTSQIDWDATTTASYEDERVYGNLNYARILPKNRIASVSLGVSNEWDVFSINGQLGWQKSFNNENIVLGIDFMGIHDKWDLIYPTDLAGKLITENRQLENDVRLTGNLSTSLSAVINPKMQVMLMYNLTLQSGLLSTPFHRVFFDTTGTNLPVIPDLDIRLTTFIGKDI